MNRLEQKRLSFAAGITVTLIVATYSLLQAISNSPEISFLYNSSKVWKTFLPFSLSGLVFLTSIAVLLLGYMVLSALRLCSSHEQQKTLERVLDFLWNLSVYLLLVFLLALVLLSLNFGTIFFLDSSVPRWIFSALLAVFPAIGLATLVSLIFGLVKRIVKRTRPKWVAPVVPAWVKFTGYGILYSFSIALVIDVFVSAGGDILAMTDFQGGVLTFLVLVLYPLGILGMTGPFEKYLKLDGWTKSLRVWVRAPLICGFFLVCAGVQFTLQPDPERYSSTAYVTPYFGDFQIQVDSKSPRLAVLRIRPRGFLDFDVKCYDVSTKHEKEKGCDEYSATYDGDFDAVCFENMDISLIRSSQSSAPYWKGSGYGEIPCVGSWTIGERPTIFSPGKLAEKKMDSRRLVVTNDDFQKELDWWFDPTLLTNNPGCVWRAQVDIDSIVRSTYFSVTSCNKPDTPTEFQ